MREQIQSGQLPGKALPGPVLDVFKHFYTAEMTSLARDGTPITWPVLPIFWERRGVFVTFTSIGLPQKAFNLRRNPKTALLFSESTGSDLENPPIVLVQGCALAEDRLIVSGEDSDPELLEALVNQAQKMIERQPAMPLYMSNPVTRYLMDWYFMRLMIVIEPRTITWWEGGSYDHPPQRWEAGNVG